MQRTAQYVVPLGCGPFPPDKRERMSSDPHGFVTWALDSATVFGLEESTTAALSVSPEQRRQIYEAAWQRGGGFGFMLETFGDIVAMKRLMTQLRILFAIKSAASSKTPMSPNSYARLISTQNVRSR